MKLDLDKKGLICLVKGNEPSYNLFDNELIKKCGTYNGSYGTWHWETYELLKLTDAELYSIYILCRDSD